MRKREKKYQQSLKIFFSRRRFDDFEELAESTQGWSLEFRKIDAGLFTGDLMQLKSGPVLLSRFSINSRLILQGSEPQAGFRRFGIPVGIHQASLWRGKKLEKKTIQIYPDGGELEGTSAPNLTTFIALISEERLAELGQLLHVPLPWELPGKPEVVDCEPVKLAQFHQTLNRMSQMLTEDSSRLEHPMFQRELEYEIPQQLLMLLSQAVPSDIRPPAQQRTRTVKKALTYINDHAH
ncbi:MAG: hypothetical protein GY801_50800 [bacterium]|nr:hypothetical protein [bacterium]